MIDDGLTWDGYGFAGDLEGWMYHGTGFVFYREAGFPKVKA